MKIDTSNEPTVTVEYHLKDNRVFTAAYYDDYLIITRELFEALLSRQGKWRAYEVDEDDNQ